MSLTNILGYKRFQDLRTKLKTDFIRPKIDLKNYQKDFIEIKSNKYSLIGTAYDYLLRFKIQQLNKGKIIDKGYWVSDIAYNSIINYLSNNSSKTIFIGYKREKEVLSANLKSIIIDNYLLAKKNYSSFLKTGKFTKSLIKSSLFLASLDIYYRAGIIDINLTCDNKQEINDINNIIVKTDFELFRANKTCYLNPTFGYASSFVGGADADLIIDDTLIEIKTLKKLEISRSTLNQLICYYFLSIMGGVNSNSDDKPIKKIGVFMPRYCCFWTINLCEIIHFSKIENFGNWFIDFINVNLWNNQPIPETELFKIRLKTATFNSKLDLYISKLEYIDKKYKTEDKKREMALKYYDKIINAS